MSYFKLSNSNDNFLYSEIYMKKTTKFKRGIFLLSLLLAEVFTMNLAMASQDPDSVLLYIKNTYGCSDKNIIDITGRGAAYKSSKKTDAKGFQGVVYELQVGEGTGVLNINFRSDASCQSKDIQFKVVNENGRKYLVILNPRGNEDRAICFHTQHGVFSASISYWWNDIIACRAFDVPATKNTLKN
jgi:hypothetical protein